MQSNVSVIKLVLLTASLLVLFINLSHTKRWLLLSLSIAACAPLTAIYNLSFIALDKGEWSVGFMPCTIYQPHSTPWIQGWVGPKAGVDPVEMKISAPCWQSLTSAWRPAPSTLPVTELPHLHIANTVIPRLTKIIR